jgi:transposase
MPCLACKEENGCLLPLYLAELIPADHVAKAVNNIVDLLDIRNITSRVKVEGRQV